jgi:hypothetical protein
VLFFSLSLTSSPSLYLRLKKATSQKKLVMWRPFCEGHEGAVLGWPSWLRQCRVRWGLQSRRKEKGKWRVELFSVTPVCEGVSPGSAGITQVAGK